MERLMLFLIPTVTTFIAQLLAKRLCWEKQMLRHRHKKFGPLEPLRVVPFRLRTARCRVWPWGPFLGADMLLHPILCLLQRSIRGCFMPLGGTLRHCHICPLMVGCSLSCLNQPRQAWTICQRFNLLLFLNCVTGCMADSWCSMPTTQCQVSDDPFSKVFNSGVCAGHPANSFEHIMFAFPA